MSAVGSFFFTNLVLPAIAVQAKETNIDEAHRDAVTGGTAKAQPVDKLGFGGAQNAAPTFASRRDLLGGRQISRPVDDDGLYEELLSFREWQRSRQQGLSSRQLTGGTPTHFNDGLRPRRTSGGAPNIIVVNTGGGESSYHTSNLTATQDPGQGRESGLQILDASGHGIQSSTVPPSAQQQQGLPVITEEKATKEVAVDMGDGQYEEVVKPETVADVDLTKVDSPQLSQAAASAKPTDQVVVHNKMVYTHEELYVAATQFYHRLLAEALGTWAVTFFIAGLVIESSLGHIPQMGVAIGGGLVFVLLIYSLGQVSGAHFNPVVTYAFVLRGMFPLLWLPFYWICQFVGAIIAAAMLLGFYGATEGGAGATLVPQEYSEKQGFLMETVLVFLLVFTILSMASRSKIVGPHAALAIGAVIALNIMFAGSYSGASMNPWRSVCVSLVFPVSFYSIWVYFAGPFLGATIAVVFVFLLAGRPHNEELSAGIGATIAVAVGNAISRDDEEGME